MANITPIFEKGSKNKKESSRLISILPVLSKIFEKLMSKQLSTFFENMLSKFRCGFRKGYNTQHCLLLMLEKWKLAVNNNEAFGDLLTDLSKAFECLSSDLLIVKLDSYSLSWTSLSCYLSNCKQQTKVENVFSKWQNIETGVPQGSILGPLLYNNYFASYEDDNTLYDNTPYLSDI